MGYGQVCKIYAMWRYIYIYIHWHVVAVYGAIKVIVLKCMNVHVFDSAVGPKIMDFGNVLIWHWKNEYGMKLYGCPGSFSLFSRFTGYKWILTEVVTDYEPVFDTPLE